MSRRAARVGLAVPALLLGASLAGGCTSAPDGHASEPTGTASAASVAQTGTRWWSNGHDAIGSRIVANDPGAAADALNPSRPVYCTMLRQTVARGQGLVDTHGDTGVAAAFVAEITRVAPTTVAPSWRVLDPAISALLSGRATPAATDRAAVRRATARVAADAKDRCGVSLSQSVP